MGEANIDSSPSPAPISTKMLLHAGAGSLSAQRDARDAALKLIGSGAVPDAIALAVAEALAWMASRSNEAADLRELALIQLRIVGGIDRPMDQRLFCHAQAIAFLDLAADAGDSEAVKILEDVTAAAPVELVANAKDYKKDWQQTLAALTGQD